MIDSLRRAASGAPRCFRALAAAAAVGALAAGAAPLAAQVVRPDTTRPLPDSLRARLDSLGRRPAARPPSPRPGLTPDTIPRPPVTPRAAFLSSLLVPGLGQTRLGRPTSAAVFISIDLFAVAMARKAGSDLRLARSRARDSIPASYERNADGTIRTDASGNPVVVYARNRYAGTRVRARRTHYEDWIAAMLFNHLFSGADAFVAAQLWDLPSQVSFRTLDGEPALVVSVAF